MDELVVLEEPVLPLAMVDSTDGECIGRALLTSIETHIFGMPWAEFLKFVKGLHLTFFAFIWACDAARTNFFILKRLDAYHRAFRMDLAIACHFIWWVEKCWLHQLSRSLTVLLQQLGMSTFLKAFSKLNKFQRVRSQLHECHSELFASDIR